MFFVVERVSITDDSGHSTCDKRCSENQCNMNYKISIYKYLNHVPRLIFLNKYFDLSFIGVDVYPKLG